jgi:molybdenum-dependent DNA-binding transcriptional regulator ModE
LEPLVEERAGFRQEVTELRPVKERLPRRVEELERRVQELLRALADRAGCQ